MTQPTIIGTFALCGGTLTGWVRRPPALTYDGDSGPAELWATFERDGRTTDIRSADRLFTVLVERCVSADLGVQVALIAAPLSELTAFLMGDGSAVTDVELFDFLDESHGLAVRDHLPRVEGPFFRFLLGQFERPRDIRLFEVEIDLRTGAITRRPLP